MLVYDVRVVDDDLMMNDDWMLVEMVNGDATLILSRSAAGSPRTAAEAWAAVRMLLSPPQLAELAG